MDKEFTVNLTSIKVRRTANSAIAVPYEIKHLYGKEAEKVVRNIFTKQRSPYNKEILRIRRLCSHDPRIRELVEQKKRWVVSSQDNYIVHLIIPQKP